MGGTQQIAHQARAETRQLTVAQSRILSRATAVLMLSIVISLASAYAIYEGLDRTPSSVLLAGLTYLAIELAARAIFWQITRPLAQLAMGPDPIVERVGNVCRSDLVWILLVLGTIPAKGFDARMIGYAMLLASVASLALWKLRDPLQRLNDAQAAASLSREVADGRN
jgi:hypothetical protein